MLRRIPIPVAVSVLAILLAVSGVLVEMPPLLTALVRPAPSDDDPGRIIDDYVKEHGENQHLDRDRFTGRYLFFAPPPPPLPTPKREPVRRDPVVRRPEPTPIVDNTPPPPDVYQGPSVNFAVGAEVWFMGASAGESSFKVRVGEEQNGVRVVSVDLPWSVTVNWRNKDFELPLLERNVDQFFTSAAPVANLDALMKPAESTPAVPASAGSDVADAESARAQASESTFRPPNPMRGAVRLPSRPAPEQAASPADRGTDDGSGDAGDEPAGPPDQSKARDAGRTAPRRDARTGGATPSRESRPRPKGTSGRPRAESAKPREGEQETSPSPADKPEAEGEEPSDDGVPPS